MSLVPLTITHPGGDRTIGSYTVPLRTRPRDLALDRNRGGAMTSRGDQLERPTPLTVIAELPAATLATAYALAYQVITEAEAATSVRTHEGTTPVRGLISYEIRPQPSSVVLALRWAQATADTTPVPPG